MAAATHTFANIFDTEIKNEGKAVKLKSIVIPIIQRDYAQGRKDAETERIRERFLDSMHQAVTGEPITLDFIYGDVDSDGVMTPLDGQQRLTTLFLLHWYAAKKDHVESSDYQFLKRFSYETRYSARDFCMRLIDFQPSFPSKISDEIKDQPWFPFDWLKDQTVASMLNMLDSINEHFAGVGDLWHRLNNGSISFYFLPTKDMGLTDELYIKMNSRGKPLTLFEHFKAEFEHNLREIDPCLAERIIKKIDKDWTNMLWNYRGTDNVIDDEFLRYFRFICDLLCYRSGSSPQGKSNDEFALLEEYFSVKKASENNLPAKNAELLERLFDCWCKVSEGSPTAFLEKCFSHEYSADKTKIEKRYEIDIFQDCLRNYADIVGGRNRKFPLNRIVLLYGIVVYLLYRDKVSESDFLRRLRTINNLVQNSDNEISDSESRVGGNRMPAIFRQVDAIMQTGSINFSIERSFNQAQLEEENEKMVWCVANPDKTGILFELEDHDLLYGQVGVVGLDHAELFPSFKSLFLCSWDAIDCALLASSDYVQTDRNGWRHQLGSSSQGASSRAIDVAWKNLFHRSANDGFDKTSNALRLLLSKSKDFSDEFLNKIASDYLVACEVRQEYDWKYYYIKYPSFRPGRYGKYSWVDYENKPYELLALWAEYYWSSRARQPFLYEIDKDNINHEDNGWSLIYNNIIVRCKNSAFFVYRADNDEELARIEIAQNEYGIDSENRIIKGIAQIPPLVSRLQSEH